MEKRERNTAAGTDPVTTAQRRAWRLTYITAKPVMAHKYNFTCDQIGINGPFLLVSNHACNADPILIGLSSKDMPLTYVASEHLERMGVVTKLLTRYYSIIPRKKASSAADTVKSVLRALKRGAPVVLFAEGECTWDGVSAPVFPATGKLAKVSRVPLVTYRLEGNYLSVPRWADSSRRGRIRGRVVHRYSPEELAKMSPDAITAAINRDIYEDAWETQRRDNVILASRKRAEGLEKKGSYFPKSIWETAASKSFLTSSTDSIFHLLFLVLLMQLVVHAVHVKGKPVGFRESGQITADLLIILCEKLHCLFYRAALHAGKLEIILACRSELLYSVQKGFFPSFQMFFHARRSIRKLVFLEIALDAETVDELVGKLYIKAEQLL